MKYCIGVIASLFLSFYGFCQDNSEVKDIPAGLRAEGKIYVVLAVAVTILIGLVIYLISLDRKISRLEKHHS